MSSPTTTGSTGTMGQAATRQQRYVLNHPSSNNNNNNNNNTSTSSSSVLIAPDGTTILSEAQMEAIMDHSEEAEIKTWTRMIVENILSKLSFYAPRKDMLHAPSFTKAYKYYELITLPRHIVVGDNATSELHHVLRKAEPGATNQRTELYSPFFTPASSFIEWGIGIDLYFSTLWIMALVLFICGCIHLPNLIFYRSSDYAGMANDSTDSGGDSTSMAFTKSDIWSLRGSAICTNTSLVVCSDCDRLMWPTANNNVGTDRFLFANDGTWLVLRNLCPGGELPQGLVNLVVLFFLIIVLILLSMYLGAREIRFDEDKITATDYSIIVKNPPKDAYDPDEWRDFFTQFAEKQVTAVTIALNNQVMINKLIARRIHRKNLRLMLSKSTDMEDEDAVRTAVAQLVQDRDAEPQGCIGKIFGCTLLPILRIFNMFLPAETLVDRVFQLTEDIKQLQTEKFDVTKVFVTFETEEGQRAALEAMAIGRLDVMMNNKNSIAPSALFKDTILKIGEPSEPSAVRWLDLSASTLRKGTIRFLNVGVTILLIALTGFIVAQARFRLGPWAAAPLISISNTLIPLIVKILMIFEPHGTEGSFQAALYLKITIFRWVNTAFLIKVLTPWTSTLQSGPRDVLPQINAILWAELWITPTLRLLDLYGNFKKHILAPRERNQELMNLNFQGTRYNLGERYTDLTKVLFVCFYYAALYPAVFFFGTAILIVQYYADKFCLMRIWANNAALGSEVAKFSRKYFFSFAVVAYAIVSAYAFAGFPYDNLCSEDNPEYGGAGNYTVNSTVYEVTIDEKFVYCDQKWSAYTGLPFPPTAKSQPRGSSWMTESQESLVTVYGWTACAILIGYVTLYFGSNILAYVRSWFQGVLKTTGQKQNIDFSSNAEIVGFVPQVRVGGFPFPFLTCDIDNIDQSLIGWNDPTHSYDFHNVLFDIPWKGMTRSKIIEGNTRDTSFVIDQSGYIENTITLGPDGNPLPALTLIKPIFSIIKHYPPPWRKNLKESTTS